MTVDLIILIKIRARCSSVVDVRSWLLEDRVLQCSLSLQIEKRVAHEVAAPNNDAPNTFYLRLYGVGHMVKDHSDSVRGNPLPPHGLFFPINSKGSFICTIPQTG